MAQERQNSGGSEAVPRHHSGSRMSGFAYGVPIILGGFVALGTPLLASTMAALVLGLFLIGAGTLQAVQILNAPGPTPAQRAFISPAISVIGGLLLIASPRIGFGIFAMLLGLSWIADGIVRIGAAVRQRRSGGALWRIVDGVFNVLIGLAVAVQWPLSGQWALGLLVGLRLLATGWTILLGREMEKIPAKEEETVDRHPDPHLRLPPDGEFARVRETFAAQEPVRAKTARRWRLVFIFTFFVIHLGRMPTAAEVANVVPPAVATFGDILLSLLLAYLIVAPLRTVWRWLTRPLERRVWQRYLAQPSARASEHGERQTTALRWVRARMRGELRDLRARNSASAAVGWGLSFGLPLSAILIALNPIWGFSWYFNSENWVTIISEKWSAERTDDWRVAMATAVHDAYENVPLPDLFRISPPGVEGDEDFSFVVIGDTGEGDASQHILRDQYLRLGNRPEVKFLVISSDVIYPAGAMSDYEPKFYLPFKGFDKPIYALPGNHDWFDALDAFVANFFQPNAAITAMRARREADLNLTTTTEADIHAMVEQAHWLREQYDLQTGLQVSPFFEMQTRDFALLVVDTGVLRTVDPFQMQWLRQALERSRSKFKMAILGHPLYAAGEYRGNATETFAELHRLLKEHQVDVVMAGDTHAFEHYKEFYGDSGEHVMYHFTNGGGGAYLSIETPLEWPANPPVDDWAYYPRTDAIVAKLETETSFWKWPIWVWVRDFSAWPSSTANVASAFDFNRTPFYQSFMEIRVERSAGVVRLLLYNAHGRLRWQDLQRHGAIGEGQKEDDLVEFRFPLTKAEQMN